MRNADAVENPERTGSDRNVAIAPTPKMRMIMCQKPTHSVKATVTCTYHEEERSTRPFVFRCVLWFGLGHKANEPICSTDVC